MLCSVHSPALASIYWGIVFPILASAIPFAAPAAGEGASIEITLENGVQTFEIFRLYPDRVIVMKDKNLRFELTPKEVLKATNKEVEAHLSDAKGILGKVPPATLDRLPELKTSLELGINRIEEDKLTFGWLIPELAATTASLKEAQTSVEGALDTTARIEKDLKKVREAKQGGTPFPEKWEDLFAKAQKQASAIALPQVRTELADRLDRESRETKAGIDRSTTARSKHLEEMTEEVRKGLLEGTLLRERWESLLQQISEEADKIPDPQTRKQKTAFLDGFRQRTGDRLKALEEKRLYSQASAKLDDIQKRMENQAISEETKKGFLGQLDAVAASLPESATRQAFEETIAGIRSRPVPEPPKPATPTVVVMSAAKPASPPPRPHRPHAVLELSPAAKKMIWILSGGILLAISGGLLYLLTKRSRPHEQVKGEPLIRPFSAPMQKSSTAEDPSASPLAAAPPPFPLDFEEMEGQESPREEASPAPVDAAGTGEEPQHVAAIHREPQFEPVVVNSPQLDDEEADSAAAMDVRAGDGEGGEEPFTLAAEILPLTPISLGMEKVLATQAVMDSGLSNHLREGALLEDLSPLSAWMLGRYVGLAGQTRAGDCTLALIDRSASTQEAFLVTELAGDTIASLDIRGQIVWALTGQGLRAYMADGLDLTELLVLDADPVGRAGQPFAERFPWKTRKLLWIGDEILVAPFPQTGIVGYRVETEGRRVSIRDLWRFSPAPGENVVEAKAASNLVSVEGKVGVLTSQGVFCMVNPSDGALLSETPLGGAWIPASGLAAIAASGDRIVYVGQSSTGERFLRAHCLSDPDSSAQQEILLSEEAHVFHLEDGFLLLSDQEASFFEEGDLSLRWRYPMQGRIPVDFAADRSEIALLMTDRQEQSSSVVVFGKNSGLELWDVTASDCDMTRIAGILFQAGWMLLWGEKDGPHGVLKLL
jgi:hypothetical protein